VKSTNDDDNSSLGEIAKDICPQIIVRLLCDRKPPAESEKSVFFFDRSGPGVTINQLIIISGKAIVQSCLLLPKSDSIPRQRI
jgi:hypothetical protein